MPRKTSKKLIISSRRLMAAGWGLIFIFGLYRLYTLKILSFSQTNFPPTQASTQISRIDIDRVFIHLPVNKATVTDGTWEISPDSASHWDNSAGPGDDGNIVIYGHNKTNLFGPIRWLNPGDTIKLTNILSQEFTYKVTEIATVAPNQVEYILPKDQETLTLYTCTGLFDSQRYIVIAKII